MVLPERNGKVITIQHHATANSGLPRMPLKLQPKYPLNPYIDYRNEELAYFIRNYELMSLVGFIVTRIYEKPYRNALEQLITKPIKINHTYISGMRTAKL